MNLKKLAFALALAIGFSTTHAASPCDGKTMYNTGNFIAPSAAIFSKNPLPYLGLGTGTILGQTNFPNGVLMIQWPTSPTNYLLLPMDYPWSDALASGAIKAAEEGHSIVVAFCFDPVTPNVRLIDYVIFGR